MENLNKFLGNLPLPVQTMITSGNVVYSSMYLKDKGLDKTLSQFILPSFFLFFGSALCANLVFPHFQVTSLLLSSYYLGILLFFILKDYKYTRKIFSIFPIVGKMFLIQAMVNNDRSLAMITLWFVTNDFVGVALRHLIGKDKLIIDDMEIVDIFMNVCSVSMGRTYHLSAAMIAGLVLIFHFLKITILYFRSNKMEEPIKIEKNKRKTPSKRTRAVASPIPKTPIIKKEPGDEEPSTRRRAAARKLNL
ncbi:hypothetical protein TCON_1257 [Astathelohania contejeani]|uniref:Uncharacterized protein n=1 Tax=Astathelohania contejeani TaxID=164912 RepID=A0ABQ7HZA9_9MICR|nr:hypothetical protein TCON_1257 [Thelohania contejeani]